MTDIRCYICDRIFKNVLHTHLRKAHPNFTYEEYLLKYPGAQLATDQWKQDISQIQKNKLLENREDYIRKRRKRNFDFIQEQKLRKILQRDNTSAQICLKNNLWKPAIILYGSLLEALVSEISGKRNFSDAIEFSHANGYIKDKEYHTLNVLRDLRNFVHVHKEVNDDIELSEHTAKTFAELSTLLINRIGSDFKKL